MDRAQLLAILATEIAARKCAARPLKVAIDGRCAAGKSTLAGELAPLLSARGFTVLSPSTDGFHHCQERRYRQGEFSARGYYEEAFNYEAMMAHLLQPLSGDAFPVECRQVGFDLRANLPLDAPAVKAGTRTILLS